MDTPDRIPDHERLLRQALEGAEQGPRSAPLPPAPEDLAPHFPDYEIHQLIGHGGMGAVYRARQRKLDRAVALKVLRPELATVPEFGERFLREAKALASLNHPHVLTVHDFGQVDGLFWLVTELVEGVDLRKLMELGELSPAEALRITPQICQALQYAHDHGVVHRDVKPENILIDTSGQVKIADFGLAKLLRPGDRVALTSTGKVFGTPHYMAPEQWKASTAVDHRADIYSLGVVLYEMLTGQLPLGSYDPPSQRSGVPPGLDQVVRRTLAQQPDNRYQTARELETDVRQQAREVGAPPIPAAATAERAARLSRLALVVLCVIVLGAVSLMVAQGLRLSARAEVAKQYSVYTEAIARMQDVLGRDQPWTEPVPTPPEGNLAPVLTSLEFSYLWVGALLALGLLATVLGFWSIWEIRNARGRLGGVGLAAFTAWILPLGLAGAGLVGVVASSSDRLAPLLGSVAAAAYVAGAFFFLVRETRRQTALAARGVPPAGGRPLFAAGVALALLGLAGVGVTAAVLPRTAVWAPAVQRPTPPGALLHASRAEVLSRLGPPLSITVSADSWCWDYRDATGDLIERALLFAGDEVFAYDERATLLLPNPLPRRGPYPGQSFADLVEQIGAPAEHVMGTLLTVMRYGDGLEVSVRDGVVIGSRRGG